MSGKLYKLALWYIGKCNAKWDKPKKEIETLDRLTYKNFEKYYLFCGADAEWQKFSRYDVLDNAIQKLAKYENKEEEIRNGSSEMSEIEKTCKNCKWDFEDEEGTHCRHCIHNAEEHFEQKENKEQEPTIYDIDKVVEQIEKFFSNCKNEYEQFIKNKILAIIRAGGKE